MMQLRLSSTHWMPALAFGVLLVFGAAAGFGLAIYPHTQAPKASIPAPSSAPVQRRAEPKSASSNSSGSASSAEPSADAALAWPFWEHELQAGVPARETALTPPPWRMLGAAMIDGEWQLIVMRAGGQQPEYYKRGQRLPGGILIKDISQLDVTLLSGRREIVFSYIGSR